MANYYQLQPEDRDAVFAAAGFMILVSAVVINGHEEASVQLATTFLQEPKADAAF
jgi:hypothetical protein